MKSSTAERLSVFLFSALLYVSADAVVTITVGD